LMQEKKTNFSTGANYIVSYFSQITEIID